MKKSVFLGVVIGAIACVGFFGSTASATVNNDGEQQKNVVSALPSVGAHAGHHGGHHVNPGDSVTDKVDAGDCTSILPSSWCNSKDGISSVVSMVIAILTGAVVIAGTIGIIICGVMWMTAADNEGQVVMAKKRILDIVIGVVAWVLLALLANLFIPKSSYDIEKDLGAAVTEIAE